MSVKKTNLAFKITNWCNLQCAHCYENSGPDQSPRLMNLDKMAYYLDEFNALPLAKSDVVAITGGEVMSPYYHNDTTYIPMCLDIAHHGGMLPVLKTNGVWGGDTKMRNTVFSSVADVAYANGTLVAMDISIDRFHNNLGATTNIIDALVKNPVLGYCIVLTLQGIHKNSSHAIYDLISALLTRNIRIASRDVKDKTLLLSDGKNFYPVYYNFDQSVANIGRAHKNKLGVFELTGKPDIFGDSVMIDHNDVLRLNLVRGTKINGRPIGDVIQQIKNNEIQR